MVIARLEQMVEWGNEVPSLIKRQQTMPRTLSAAMLAAAGNAAAPAADENAASAAAKEDDEAAVIERAFGASIRKLALEPTVGGSAPASG